MIRFILKRKYRDDKSLLNADHFETLDCEVPELEKLLNRGGTSEYGYDITDLIGAEVLPPKK